VTSRVATPDAQAAATVLEMLDPDHLTAEFASGGLKNPNLMAVQVTACLPGYELSSAQTCQLCPAKYFCPGGSTGRQACATGSFSSPGANSSSQCAPVVFVLVASKLPISPSNFTADFQAKFRTAMAQTAQVQVEQVVVSGQSRRASTPQLAVNAEIAADNAAAAKTIRDKVDFNSLNTNLALQGLPKSTSVTATVADTGSDSSASGVFIPAVLGGVIGGVMFLLASITAGYYLYHAERRRKVRNKFLSSLKSAKAGDVASLSHFPPKRADKKRLANQNLRVMFDPHTVLGKGDRGCVVKGTKKSTQAVAPVAIKVIVPKRDKFDEDERRQLEREATVLKLVTKKRCRSAVHAADSTDLPPRDDACWFIMEVVDGESLAAELSVARAKAASSLGMTACIQAARDVLAALKVLHSEGFIHFDVTPANIIHLSKGQSGGYEYKIIDFGKVRVKDELFEGDSAGAGAGAVDAAAEYRAPELFSRCRVTYQVDMWSLGATMFELVSGRVPFAAEGRREAIKAGVEDRAPDLVEGPSQRQLINAGLGKMIGKALEKKPENRWALAP
jgi:tRNA A-37 threonylcarbamoyl transferase component Bud32